MYQKINLLYVFHYESITISYGFLVYFDSFLKYVNIEDYFKLLLNFV